jgi:hypothetical protein
MMNRNRLRGVALGTMLAVLGVGGCQSQMSEGETKQTALAESNLKPHEVLVLTYTDGHRVTLAEIQAARAKGESVLVPLGIKLFGPSIPRSISGKNPLPGREMASR